MSNDLERSERNEIFTADQAKAQGFRTSNVMQDDFGFEIPVENVPLPSLGRVYDSESPLYGAETVQIKAMTAREEDILTSRALIKKGTVISALLKSCIIDKKINVDDLLAGDRNALMVAVRVTGYGADYNSEVDCPACGERSKQDFNLGELPIKRLGADPIAEGSNLFETVLPVSKQKVRFRFLTGRDEQELMVIAERKKKSGAEADSMITERFQRQLVAVGNVTDRSKLSYFVRNMPAGDSLHLRRFIDKNEPGIDMKTWMQCPHCGEHSEVRLPMGASFFWPDTE